MIECMKVAKKSPHRVRRQSTARVTVTLPRETYAKIDELRGDEPRSTWLCQLVEREEERRDHEEFAALLRKQYTAAVVRETLKVNEEFPIHDA